MKKKLKVLGIIPARSGSKEVKDKNIALYKGKPLIYHSIKTSLKSKYIDKTVLSTDSKKYALLGKSFGAEVPFLRPKKISNGKSLDIDFIVHATNYYLNKNYIPDIVVLLRPTSPNRKVSVVDEAIRRFSLKFNDYDSMRSVSQFNQPPQKMLKIKNKTLVGFFDNSLSGEYHNYPRQFFPKTFLPNGYIDIFKPSFFMNNKILCGKMMPFITEEILDIDNKRDFK